MARETVKMYRASLRRLCASVSPATSGAELMSEFAMTIDSNEGSGSHMCPTLNNSNASS